MKLFRHALLAGLLPVGFALAQDDEARRAPPVEIPDFSNLDEYIYEPKSTLVFGLRYVSGAKLSFGASQGRIASRNAPGELGATGLTRIYQDGAVQPDSRTIARVDGQGAPVINPDTGFQYFDPIVPDGKTNTWNYIDLGQRQREGFVAFRDYSAEIVDPTSRSEDSGATIGFDLTAHRDMGKLFGGKVAWNLTLGVSLNDISADVSSLVRARLDTLTDFYRFYPPAGGSLSDPPYSAPSSVTETVLDAAGNAVLTIDGTTEVRVTDTTVLLDGQPAQRVNNATITEAHVQNRWKLKGAYYTFRAGPTVWIPITTRLRASLSAGAALVYAGTSYTVTETLFPDVGAEITETETSDETKLLPGWYADASLQFDLTERAGFYAGAVYQSAGDYTQVVENATTSYSTKIDLSKQSGVRAGMTIRF